MLSSKLSQLVSQVAHEDRIRRLSGIPGQNSTALYRVTRHRRIYIRNKLIWLSLDSDTSPGNGLGNADPTIKLWQVEIVIPLMPMHNHRRDLVAVPSVCVPIPNQRRHPPRFRGIVSPGRATTVYHSNNWRATQARRQRPWLLALTRRGHIDFRDRIKSNDASRSQYGA